MARWVALGWTCGVEDGHDKIKVDEGGMNPVTGPKTHEKEITGRHGLNTPKEKPGIGRGRRGLNTCSLTSLLEEAWPQKERKRG